MISTDNKQILYIPPSPTKYRKQSNGNIDSPILKHIKTGEQKMSFKGHRVQFNPSQLPGRRILLNTNSANYRSLQILKGKRVKLNYEETVIPQPEDTAQQEIFQSLHPMSYSPRSKGWKDIYLGMLSPHALQYKRFVKPVLEKLQQAKKQGKHHYPLTISCIEEKINLENKFIEVLTKLREKSKAQKKLNLLKVLKDDTVEQFEEKDILRLYEDIANNRLTIKSQHLLATFHRKKVKIPMEYISAITMAKKAQEQQTQQNHLTVNVEKFASRTMPGREQRRSMHIEPKFQNNNYFINLIKSDYRIKKEMLNDFKVRRKSCQCKGCFNIVHKRRELRDPLAQNLHIEELFNKRDILQKFKENVILALQQKRAKDAEDEALHQKQKMLTNVLLKGKTLNLIAVKKKTLRPTPKHTNDSFRADNSFNDSTNKSKNEAKTLEASNPNHKSTSLFKASAITPKMRLSDKTYEIEHKPRIENKVNPFLLLTKNLILGKRFSVDNNKELLKRSNTLINKMKESKSPYYCHESFSEATESENEEDKKPEPPKQSTLYNVMFRKSSQPTLQIKEPKSRNMFFAKRFSEQTVRSTVNLQSQTASQLQTQEQKKQFDMFVDLKKVKTNSIGKAVPNLSKIQILTKLKQTIDINSRMRSRQIETPLKSVKSTSKSSLQTSQSTRMLLKIYTNSQQHD